MGIAPSLADRPRAAYHCLSMHIEGPMAPIAASLVCPSCRGPLTWGEAEAACEAEGIVYPVRSGIPELVVPASRERVAAFLDAYLRVRRDEGWTDGDAASLLALPFEDRTGRHAWMWRVRARGLAALRRALRRRFGARRLRVVE